MDDSVARPEDSSPPGNRFHIVGVGASAGGLEALETFFRNMPPDSGMAFVVLQHLSPDFESRMDELLARQTSIAIHRVQDGMAVEPDAIYLIPPKKEMIISSGRLLLTDKDPAQGLSLPIDHFFRSLAHDQGPYGVGVVLSGTGSDGSRGIRDIHAAGGLVISQREDTARFDGMPRSARNTGVVDLVLPPEEMAAALLRHAGDLAPVAPEGALPSTEDDLLRRIFKLLRGQYGIDFAHYKPTTVLRRVQRRLSLVDAHDLSEYLRRLGDDPVELDALYHDLLIGVTRFFRDVEAFAELERSVIPSLLEKGDPEEPIRVWVAGCATGEEAYSLAILLHEALQARRRRTDVKIFATDVHRGSLEIASAGVYSEELLEELTPERRDRYFRPVGDGYQVINELRQMIVFARHDVLNDAPFTRLGLVSCRNLLIYLQPLAQKKVLSLFHFALRTGGVMLLGPSETPGDLDDEFDPLDKHWRIYRKRRDVRLPTTLRLPLPHAVPSGVPTLPSRTRWARSMPDPRLLATYDHLLDRFMPPSLLVDENYELMHAFGGAERFTRIRRGRPSTHVLDLVDEELRTALSGALQHCEKERKAVRYTGVRAPAGHGEEQLRLTVEPLSDERTRSTAFLVTFETVGDTERREVVETEVDVDKLSREYIDSLEAELRFTKENLQATIEELETSNEELQATNEELVASNEELQSTNEELHSVNEELYTVNVEYQRKITELTELTDDLDNLLHSTQVGVVFLDAELRIRKFTARAATLFGLLPQDVGRHFDSFARNIEHEGLLEDVQRVLARGDALDREVLDRTGRHYLLRVLPYHTKTDAGGALVTLVDIDSLKRAEASVRRLSAIVESSHDAIIGKDLAGVVTSWNAGAEALYGYPDSEAVGRHIGFLVPDDRRHEVDEALARVREGGAVEDFDTVRVRRDGTRVDVSVGISPVRDGRGRIVGASTIARDITRRKQAEEQVREAVRQREQFLAMLSHELRNPLAAMLSAVQLLHEVERFTGPAQRALEVLHRQSGHMARLLDDLLEVSRIQQGKIRLRDEAVDLAVVARDLVEAMEARIRASEVAFAADLPAGPVWVKGDAHRLQQLQANLLTNALKYTPAGRAVRFELTADAGHAVIRVDDAGQGIPRGRLRDIFEPFVQMDATLDRSQGGMGLGLALARSIAEAHGGEIAAISDGEDRGSEFIVRLPLIPAPAEPAAASVAPRGGPRTVLVVEDQRDTCDLLCMLLEQHGYRTQSANDGREGLERALRQRPDVALLDVGLPRLDGLQLARRIREALGSERPFLIALTGYGQEKDREATRDAGFDRHLVKPVDLERLLGILAEVPERGSNN